MKKRFSLGVVPLAIVALLVLAASPALATPNKTSPCSGCHTADATVTMSVNKASETATNITYNISGSAHNGGAQGWGVFNGSAKVGGALGTGQFTVPKDGKTYSAFWIDKDPNTMKGYATTSVTAPTATTTTTAATTTTTAATTTTTARATTTTTGAATTTTTRGSTTTTTSAPTTTTTNPAPTTTTTTNPAGTTTTTTPTPLVVSFADVTSSTPYWVAIELLGRSGVVEGYQQLDGLAYFRPSALLFRAQFTKMIVQALEIPVNENMQAPFDDLGPDPANDLYPHQYVAAAYAAHIIEGLGARIFSPYTDVTRAQVISMTVRGIETRFPGLLQTPPTGYSGALGDFSAEHAESARIAQYNHLLDGLQGYGPGWDPWAPATRGEAAQMLAQLLELRSAQH